MNLKDFKTSDYEYGLTKILGKQILEVNGYISTEYAMKNRIAIFNLEDIFNGKVTHHRLRVFKTKGFKCINCDTEGREKYNDENQSNKCPNC